MATRRFNKLVLKSMFSSVNLHQVAERQYAKRFLLCDSDFLINDCFSCPDPFYCFLVFGFNSKHFRIIISYLVTKFVTNISVFSTLQDSLTEIHLG